MESYPLSFPLHHPTTILIDPVYENRIGNIILYPLDWRIRKPFGKLKRKILCKKTGKVAIKRRGG